MEKMERPKAYEIGSRLTTELIEMGVEIPFTVTDRVLSGREVVEI